MNGKVNIKTTLVDMNLDDSNVRQGNAKYTKVKNFRYKKKDNEIKYLFARLIIVSILFYLLSSFLDLYEMIDDFVEQHESWNLDEVIVVGSFMVFWMILEILILLKKSKNQSLVHKKSSFIDELTGINNRRGFFKEAEVRFKNFSKKQSSLSIYFFDILQFKNVNDSYGHFNGDKTLVAVSQFLKSFANNEDVIARIGGDEFVVLSISPHNEISNDFSDLLRQGIKVDLDHGNTPIEVFLSFGKAVYPNDGSLLEDLLNHADESMYNMKKVQYEEINMLKKQAYDI